MVQVLLPQWVLTSVFGGGNDGGSTAARAIVRQDRLVASAVFRIVCVKRPTPPTLRVGGVGVVFKSGTVLSCQDLVVQVLLPQWVLTSVFGMGTGGSPTP